MRTDRGTLDTTQAKFRLTVLHIGELVVVPRGPVPGHSMREVRRIRDAAIVVDAGRIVWFGPQAECPSGEGEVLDAEGGCVLPGLVDGHTHTVFAGTREGEFVQRIEGKSYVDIARAGGGIRTTVAAVRAASPDELVALTLPRLTRMLRNGVTTVEIKSGYGLSVADEIKMLEVVARLRRLQPIELVGTYLAAHTVPREFEGRTDEYLDAVLDDKVLTLLRDETLAEFCDVFCETTAFSMEQSRRVLTAGKRFGLGAKLHADQITQMGASRLAGEVEAISADHLERIDEAGIAALKKAGTVAVLLPGCSFFMGVEQAPARRLIGADLPVALATDYNPGSSMVESLPLVLSMACTQMRMTPIEAIVAATANAAAALNRHARLGAIEVGMQADLTLLDVPSVERWLYEPGRNCVRTVIKNGVVVHDTQE